MAAASVALAALVAVIPFLMRVFASAIAPYAPRSEFAFLVMLAVLAVLAAFATRALGVYYLVGALVGIAARQFRARLPALFSDDLIHAVEVFASFFAPFYFFHAGAHLRPEMLGVGALATGAAFLAVFVPLRVALVALHRRVALGEPSQRGRRVPTSLLPTLVFPLVLAEILAERFDVPAYAVGGIVVYTLVNALVPALTLGVPTTFDVPHAGAPTASAVAAPDAGRAHPASEPDAGPRGPLSA